MAWSGCATRLEAHLYKHDYGAAWRLWRDDEAPLHLICYKYRVAPPYDMMEKVEVPAIEGSGLHMPRRIALLRRVIRAARCLEDGQAAEVIASLSTGSALIDDGFLNVFDELTAGNDLNALRAKAEVTACALPPTCIRPLYAEETHAASKAKTRDDWYKKWSEDAVLGLARLGRGDECAAALEARVKFYPYMNMCVGWACRQAEQENETAAASLLTAAYSIGWENCKRLFTNAQLAQTLASSADEHIKTDVVKEVCTRIVGDNYLISNRAAETPLKLILVHHARTQGDRKATESQAVALSLLVNGWGFFDEAEAGRTYYAMVFDELAKGAPHALGLPAFSDYHEMQQFLRHHNQFRRTTLHDYNSLMPLSGLIAPHECGTGAAAARRQLAEVIFQHAGMHSDAMDNDAWSEGFTAIATYASGILADESIAGGAAIKGAASDILRQALILENDAKDAARRATTIIHDVVVALAEAGNARAAALLHPAEEAPPPLPTAVTGPVPT